MTTISSNESAKARSPPASSAVRTNGNVTWRKVCHASAPRSIDASSIERDVRRSRAMTLLKTTTMQNVAWPTAIVNAENPMPVVLIVALSAMPVTMPGSAIGRTNRNEIASRPKNAKRWIASAASVPSTIATSVAATPIWSDRTIASTRSLFAKATANQSVVKFAIGQVWARLWLNAYRAMTTIGRYRNPSAAIVAIRMAMRPATGHQSASNAPSSARSKQVDTHDRDRHEGVRGRERDVVGDALVVVDDVADELACSRPAAA